MNSNLMPKLYAPILMVLLAGAGQAVLAQGHEAADGPAGGAAAAPVVEIELADLSATHQKGHPAFGPRIASVEDDFVVLAGDRTPAPGRFQPMIQEGDTGYLPSDHFLDHAETLAFMNYVSYLRGKNYRHGHELTFQDSLRGWTLDNLGATRGYISGDPNAGFVAHHPDTNVIAIVLHGSINAADWVTNIDSVATPIRDVAAPDGKVLAFEGRAHRGFLNKYLSCQGEIMAKVDGLLAALTPEARSQTKFYVSGHSQAAALGQLLVTHLCLHLREHFGPDFDNAKENRVHAWLLSSPLALDQAAVAFAEQTVGKANIVVQNTWADPVPKVGITPTGFDFKSIGIPIMQRSVEAVAKADKAHRDALRAHAGNGDFTAAVWGLLANPYQLIKGSVAASHMGTDNVNYRGVGSDFAFDHEMVVKSVDGLVQGLQDAFDHRHQ